MWDYQILRRLDFRTLPLILGLMVVSLCMISSATSDLQMGGEGVFFTSFVENQLKWFGVGTLAYLFFACFDYQKLRGWTHLFYIGSIILLVGLFFIDSIHHVHRWYRIPFLGMELQPSEPAKLALVLMLSRFLEKEGRGVASVSAFFKALLLILIPFFLIVKQPDLGTALVLFPVSFGMFYFGGIHPKLLALMGGVGAALLLLVSLIFLKVIPYEEARPFATTVLKGYQYERFNPNTYHHRAAQTAIALGGVFGSGWKEGNFTGRKFLPEARTDSIFPAFVEEFGLCGAFFLLLAFFGLIYCSFQVTAVARDHFGRLLSAGITIYLATQVIINMGMMCGFLPITGVPLILISSGGSSVLSTMSALGMLQSIYTRRFMF